MSSNFVCNDALNEQIGLPLRARPILLITGITAMTTDWNGLNSVLLPFHLSVPHIRKSDKSNLPTEYGFQFFAVLSMLMWAQINWIWRNSFRQDSWFNSLPSGDTFFFAFVHSLHSKERCIIKVINFFRFRSGNSEV